MFWNRKKSIEELSILSEIEQYEKAVKRNRKELRNSTKRMMKESDLEKAEILAVEMTTYAELVAAYGTSLAEAKDKLKQLKSKKA